MFQKELPTWRSLLFCPANMPRFIAKAHSRGADAIILDLEDSVPETEKASARKGLMEAAGTVGQAEADICVRINRPLEQAVEDITAAVGHRVNALVIPKVAGPEHLQLLAEVVSSREAILGIPLGHTTFVALVETAEAIAKLALIARADSRLVAMGVGGEDLATDLDAESSADTLYVAKMLGVHAARAAGILPLGVLSSVANIDRLDEYRAMLQRSRNLGFACATCVHPTHVALINEAYGPSRAALERAQRLIAAFDAAQAQGHGAFNFEGTMIDKPVAERARRLLARARAQ
jgi:citrate lyase subunit beta/citryl-CoA lyase